MGPAASHRGDDMKGRRTDKGLRGPAYRGNLLSDLSWTPTLLADRSLSSSRFLQVWPSLTASKQQLRADQYGQGKQHDGGADDIDLWRDPAPDRGKYVDRQG